MNKKSFSLTTTPAEILATDPALIEIFDDYGLHLVPSTAVAMNAPLSKAAAWHAIRDPEKLLQDLNARLQNPNGNKAHG
jgi:hypothetical protein